jgi:uncharacterized protein YndB with AHSA1/START domain
MSKTTFTVEPDTQQVVLSRDFAAPREIVWRAMTDPDLVGQWWGPAYLTTVVDEHDFRQGGRWRFVQRDPDGNEFAFHGYFHVIEEPSEVVQTFEFEGLPERHVLMETARLTESGGVTTLTTTSVYQSAADRDGMVAMGMEEGAVAGMEQLAEIVERSLAESAR